MKRRAFIAGLATLPFIGTAARGWGPLPVSNETLLLCDVTLRHNFNRDLVRHEFELSWHTKRQGDWIRRARSWYQYDGRPVDVPMKGLPTLRVSVVDGKVKLEWVIV